MGMEADPQAERGGHDRVRTYQVKIRQRRGDHSEAVPIEPDHLPGSTGAKTGEYTVDLWGE